MLSSSTASRSIKKRKGNKRIHAKKIKMLIGSRSRRCPILFRREWHQCIIVSRSLRVSWVSEQRTFTACSFSLVDRYPASSYNLRTSTAAINVRVPCFLQTGLLWGTEHGENGLHWLFLFETMTTVFTEWQKKLHSTTEKTSWWWREMEIPDCHPYWVIAQSMTLVYAHALGYILLLRGVLCPYPTF